MDTMRPPSAQTRTCTWFLITPTVQVARQALMFVSTYREEYWVATPLNPAALESSK
jgi:hypothetical protein